MLLIVSSRHDIPTNETISLTRLYTLDWRYTSIKTCRHWATFHIKLISEAVFVFVVVIAAAADAVGITLLASLQCLLQPGRAFIVVIVVVVVAVMWFQGIYNFSRLPYMQRNISRWHDTPKIAKNAHAWNIHNSVNGSRLTLDKFRWAMCLFIPILSRTFLYIFNMTKIAAYLYRKTFMITESEAIW